MSVLFLPPPSAASVPDATETVSGKIRIATSAEATAGTLDTAAMTPLKVKSVVDSAIVGGVTYQGTFDTSSPDDLSNAEKGDLYIISVAGTYQGITWAVGDHLLVNADMGGTVSPSKLDKVDNTDAVTSVAGRTGAVTLSASDVSGLAAVATSGAYSDLSGTPALASVATSGAYSDLSGAPTNVSSFTNDAGYLTSAPVDSVAGKTGAVTLDLDDLEDVTISTPSAGQAIVYNGTLSAFENSTITASVANLDDIGDVTTTGVSDGEALVYNQSIGKWISGSAANSVINQYNATGTAAAVNTQDLHVYRLYGATGFSLAVSATQAGGLVLINNLNLSDCTITGPTFRVNGEGTSGGVTSITVKSSERRLFYLEQNALWLEITATSLDRLADVSLSSPSAGEALIYNGTLSAFESSTVSVANLGDIGDVTITTPQDNAVLKYDSASNEWIDAFQVDYIYTSTTQTLAAKDGVNKVMFGALSQTTSITLTVTISSARTILFVVNRRGATCDLVIGSDTWSLATGEGGLWIATGVNHAVRVSDLTPTLATVATTGAYSDLSGTPTLATVATTGAYSDLSGTPTLATVATTGAYSDLSGTPTLGTAAAEDVGTSAGNVVQLDGTAKLPAIDGSQLLNIPSGTSFFTTTVASSGTVAQITTNCRHHYNLIGSTSAITIPSAGAAAVGGVYSVRNGTGSAITVSCPSTALMTGFNVSSYTVQPYEVRAFTWISSSVTHEIMVNRLERLNDVDFTSLSNGDLIKYNSTSGDWENGALAASEITGLGTAAAEDVGTAASNVVQLDGSARLPAVDGSQLINLPATAALATVTSAAPTTSYSVSITNNEQVYLLSPTNAVTVTVPAPTTYTGKRIHIKMLTAQSLSIVVSGGSLIDGQSSISVTAQYTSLGFISDGTNWHIF